MELLLPGLGQIVFTFIAFIIVLFILKKYAWKPILKGLNDREKGIADALAAAENAKKEMANLKNENEALLAKAQEERAALLKTATETRDKIIADAQTKAKAEYERIVSDAQEKIEQETNAALLKVKNEVGLLAIEVAEKVLRKQLANKAEQEKYIKQLTSEVKLN
ncbi:MAG: F0F1 ATP synthase subunit B [Chitinophagaceae bacterium]|jgi:F-type H+-transporting ATPase subunit b|nr:F0F1 ATP synthase subunit B [Chitinophagaceae bacterium]